MFLLGQSKGWSTILPWVEYWNNTSYQGAAKCTPFETVYGRAPPALVGLILGETLVESVAQELQTGDEALRQLKFHLTRAQDMMVKQANLSRKPVTIKVYD